MRVGTHALKPGSGTSLWNRLSQHRGQVRSGGGNHRGSIFRLIVGTALIARHGYEFPTWDDRASAASSDIRAGEAALEREVSKTIGAMRFLWLGAGAPSRVLARLRDATAPLPCVCGPSRVTWGNGGWSRQGYGPWTHRAGNH